MKSRSTKKVFIELLVLGISIIAVSFLLNRSLAFGVKHSNDAQTGKVNLIMQNRINAQMIIFGSSVAEVGFNSNLIADITQKTVYNAALDGTRLSQYKFLVEEILENNHNLETIVLGFSFFSLSPSKALTEPSRFFSYIDNERIKAMFYENNKNEYLKQKWIPMYPFTQYKHTYYKNCVIGYMNYFKGVPITMDNLRGWVPHDKSWYGEEISFQDYGKASISIDTGAVGSLVTLAKYAKERNIRLMVVLCPLFISAQKYYSNFDALKEVLLSLSSEGVMILDYTSDRMNSNKDFFYNNGHLNLKGANLFSREFARDYLINCVDQPDY